MICIDCYTPVRANAKRCPFHAAAHYMEAMSLHALRNTGPKKLPEPKAAKRARLLAEKVARINAKASCGAAA